MQNEQHIMPLKFFRRVRPLAGLMLVLTLAACSSFSLPFFGDDETVTQSDENMDARVAEHFRNQAEVLEHYRTRLAKENEPEVIKTPAVPDVKVMKPNKIEILLGLSRNLRWAGKPDEAAKTMDDSDVEFGDDGRYLAELGKVRIAQGRMAEGTELLARAATKRPDDWRLLSALGIGNDYQGRYTEAMVAYEQALRICPDDAAVINNMGISQAMAGNVDRAIITLQSALEFGRHGDRIKRNLKTFRDARDLCSDCGAKYLRETGRASLAAGMVGTDAMAPCKPLPAYTEPEVEAMTEQLKEAPSINIKVYFEFDSAILRPEAQSVLDELGAALTSDDLKGYRFEIAGHTDAVGPATYNQKLSEQRANAVLDYLVLVFNIDASRIDTAGYGESRLLDPNDPDGDINRRVQITRLDMM